MKSEDVKLENKFAPVALKVPICSDPEQAMMKVKPVTRQLKASFPQIYATYVLSLFVSLFIPNVLAYHFGIFGSSAFTCAFSNTPGISKPTKYNGVELERV